MMLQKLTASLSCMWLFMVISSVAQTPPSNDLRKPVLDTNNQPLVSDAHYFVKPADPNRGGSLTVVTRNNSGSCPAYVGQVENPEDKAVPVKFTLVDEEGTLIKEGMSLVIEFEASSSCSESTEWRVGEDEPVMERTLISIGRENLVHHIFRIVSNNGLYHLAQCSHSSPSCENCTTECHLTGILGENGVRLLALNGPELPFVFEKAT